jgi:hypothetical protein
MSDEIRPEDDIRKWQKKIEMIGIDIKDLEQDVQTGRLKLKTKFINQHFINELDKGGLLLIGITGTFTGKLLVTLEPKV